MSLIRFHLISKGNNGTQIFYDDNDRAKYMNLISEIKEKDQFELNHFTLMDTHVHENAGFKSLELMAGVMKFVNEHYARYYRAEYGGSGHVFRNRFKRFVIEDDSYMLTCGIYIELNAVRAGMANHPKDYRWSSHRFYVNDEPNPLLTHSPTFLGLSGDADLRRQSYTKLTRMWIDKPVSKSAAKNFFKSRTSVLHPCLSTQHPYLPIRQKKSLTKNMSDTFLV